MSQNYFYPPTSSSSGITANQGTPNNDANAWPVRITDGTHDATVTAGGALNVSISGGITNPLPVTDAAAEASLASIDTKTPTVGQKAMAASSPVVIASDQSAVPISAASLPLPTGASTSALQTTGNTSLSSIDGKLNSLGQKAMAASVPVVIASDQSAVTVTGIVATTAPVNTNGTIVNTSLTATTASSASAPATAIGFILEAPSTNTDNIRWCIGSTASTTVGMLTEPGRDSGFVPCKATISICSTVSGTNAFSIQWIQSS